MDICDFFRRNTFSDKFITNIVIYTEVAFFFKRLDLSDRLLILSIIGIFTVNSCFSRGFMRYTQITEDDLSELVLSRFSVDTGYVLNTLIQLSFGIILKQRINKTGIKSEFSSIARYLEHIVYRRIDVTAVDSIGSV